MSKIQVIFLLIIFCFSSCETDKKEKAKIPSHNCTDISNDHIDSFVNRPLTGAMTLYWLTENLNNWKIQRKPQENKHFNEIIDTIYTLTDSKSFIKYYKTNAGKEMLMDFIIKSNEIKLKQPIRIGMKKDELIKLLKINTLQCDTIKLTDTEGFSKLLFVLKNDTLSEAIYSGYID